MNTVFNINRFLKLEKRNFFLSRMSYLYIAGGIAGLYLLSMLLKILTGTSLSGLVLIAVIVVVVAGACFFEKSMSKHKSVFDFILPVSTFEKFLSIWLKYVIYIPGMILLLLFILNLITGLFPVEGMQIHAEQISLKFILITKTIITVLAMQAVFITGYFYFRKYAFAKTTLILLLGYIGIIISCIIMGYYLFRSEDGSTFARFSLGPATNQQESFEMGYQTGRVMGVGIFLEDTFIRITNIVVSVCFIALPVSVIYSADSQ